MAAQLVKGVVVAAHSIKLSIIIPVLNEGAGLAKLFDSLQPIVNGSFELIFVDGGSEDTSVEQLRSYARRSAAHVSVTSSPCGRAIQLNTGASQAKGHVLLFLHADTLLPKDTRYQFLGKVSGDKFWGRFDVQLDCNTWPFRVISAFINGRSRLSGIATGDQAIFVSKKLFEQVGGFPDQLLMEDVELSKRLKLIASPICLGDKVITSARKWKKGGLILSLIHI